MSNNISIDEVKKLAQLSQISLSDEALASLATQMDEILGYVQQLKEVDVSGVEPTSQVTGLKNANRPDVIVPSVIGREELLANAPEQAEGMIKTKRIL